MKYSFKCVSVSDVGLVRTNNEDNLCIPGIPVRDVTLNDYEHNSSFKDKKAFFCVFDGMGGHNAGEVASKLAADSIKNEYDYIINHINKESDIKGVVNSVIHKTNDILLGMTESNPALRNMGTTMVGIFFMNGRGFCVNVGDSRLYCLSGRKLTQLSVDHSDTVNKKAITRYIGMPPEYGTADADVSPIPVKVGTGKRFLLCSDGLTDMVTDIRIADILKSKKNPSDAAETLVEEAKRMGGVDNITVAVIDVKPANPVIGYLATPVVSFLLCAAILAGGAGVALKHRSSSETVDSMSAAEVGLSVQNAKDVSEGLANLREIPNVVGEKINDYKAKLNSNSYKNINAPSVAHAKEELKNAIAEFDGVLVDINAKINEVDANKDGLAPDERLKHIKEVTGEITDSWKVAEDKCVAASNKLDDAYAAYQKSLITPPPATATSTTKKPANTNGNDKKPGKNTNTNTNTNTKKATDKPETKATSKPSSNTGDGQTQAQQQQPAARTSAPTPPPPPQGVQKEAERKDDVRVDDR